MLCTTLVYLRPVNEYVSRTFSYHVTLWVYVGPYNILVCEEPIHNTCPLLAKQNRNFAKQLSVQSDTQRCAQVQTIIFVTVVKVMRKFKPGVTLQACHCHVRIVVVNMDAPSVRTSLVCGCHFSFAAVMTCTCLPSLQHVFTACSDRQQQ
jgi:hypothetical protein